MRYNAEGLSKTERHLINLMIQKDFFVVTAAELEATGAYNRAQANLVLSRLFKKGWLQRLKAGVYRIVPLGADTAASMPEDAWAVAMALFSPCYISGWTAAEHWDLTEQIFNATVIFTSQKQRKTEQVIAGLIYRTKFNDQKNIFGTKKIWSSNKPVLIADLHRTIIDILDYPDIGGGGRHAVDVFKNYIQKKEANIETLWQYAEQLNHGAVFKRLGLLVEKLMHAPDYWVDKFHSKIKTGIINFDPDGPNAGPIITKWGMRINIPLNDLK